jgi:hypothetical protein
MFVQQIIYNILFIQFFYNYHIYKKTKLKYNSHEIESNLLISFDWIILIINKQCLISNDNYSFEFHSNTIL